MNFSNFSTLQYLSAFQAYTAYLKQKSEEPFDLKLMAHDPTEQECNSYDKGTYVLVKKDDKWNFLYFKDGKKLSEFGTNRIKGLDTVLNTLPSKDPELLSPSEIEPVRK